MWERGYVVQVEELQTLPFLPRALPWVAAAPQGGTTCSSHLPCGREAVPGLLEVLGKLESSCLVGCVQHSWGCCTRLPCQQAFCSMELMELPWAAGSALAGPLGCLISALWSWSNLRRSPGFPLGSVEGLHVVPSLIPQRCLGQCEHDPWAPTGRAGV